MGRVDNHTRTCFQFESCGMALDTAGHTWKQSQPFNQLENSVINTVDIFKIS